MAHTDVFSLATLPLGVGEARHLRLPVVLAALEFGGQIYRPLAPTAEAALDATRTVGGWSLRLRFSVTLAGPCMRCLDEAELALEVDVREVDQPGAGEELHSPYVVEADLDVRAWARDSVVLELPAHIVCREDCRGLCPGCGENLNDLPEDHAHEAPVDTRWAKLSEIRFD